jgi:gliding motility-associated-like protein
MKLKTLQVVIFSLFIFGTSIFPLNLFSQISIQSGVDPEAMVENIVGEGVQYDNVSFTGAYAARGIFSNGATTNLGIDGGIFLTSGAGYNIPGPNTQTGATANNGMPGNAILTSLAGQTTYDAAILEFDFVPESDTLRFKYVFGSEEYPEYVTFLFNDVFGYFISGPNPEGGTYTDENVAIVPGSEPPLPVAIATINNVYPSYPQYYVNNTGGLTIEYDGFTTVLTAWIRVIACETYHIKMAVADAGDGILDTGVFIEENSFESPKIEVETEPIPEGVSEHMVEGCVEADVVFRLPNTSYSPITIQFEVEGTATPGIDYEPIPDEIFIPEGQDTASIHVVPLQDGILEGDETIEFIVTNELGCEVRIDTIMFTILDYVEMVTDPIGTTAICEGEDVDIHINTYYGIGPFTYEWELLPDEDNDTVTVSPDETTVYVAHIFDQCGGEISDSVKVIVIPLPDLDFGPDTVLCSGDTLFLNAGSEFTEYLWQDGSTDSTYTVTQSGMYWVYVTGNGGCTITEVIQVEFVDINAVELGADTAICEGESVIFDAGPGYGSYLWQDGSSGQTYTGTITEQIWVQVANGSCAVSDTVNLIVDPGSTAVDLGADTLICYGTDYLLNPGVFNEYLWQNGSDAPVYLVTEPGTYWVSVVGGCGSAQDTITIDYMDPVNVDLGEDVNMCFGQSTTLNAGFGFISYVWQDGSTSQQLNVYESGVYYVNVEDIFGCPGGDTATVEVADYVILPADTTICEGNILTVNAGYGFDSYVWSTGSTSQVLEVEQGGTYYVDVAYTFGCPSVDTIVVDWFPLPTADLGENAGICEGSSIVLTGPDGDFDYYWNGVLGEQTYEVTEGGTYELKVGNYCGEATDEVIVEQYPSPAVDLGGDNLLYPDEEYQLDAGEHDGYLWFDGTSGRYYQVSFDNPSNDDLYWVEVVNSFNCKSSDTIFIEMFDIFIPIVITPNADGDNDRFEPDPDRWNGVHDHTMTVFNRWGEKVWESNDFASGWDGKVNGNYVAEGTYYWLLQIKYGPNNVTKDYKGSLTVMGTQ